MKASARVNKKAIKELLENCQSKYYKEKNCTQNNIIISELFQVYTPLLQGAGSACINQAHHYVNSSRSSLSCPTYKIRVALPKCTTNISDQI